LPPRRVYWDSCAFLGLLNQEPGRVNDCRLVWDEGNRGETTIFTSFFTYAEVFKAKCEGKKKPLPEDQDREIEKLFRQAWVTPVLVDDAIGTQARRLMRKHSECGKPADAIHLATALRLKVDEMHTFDGCDLLKLDGRVLRPDSVALRICKVNPIPPPPPAPARDPELPF
jgi:predicted nucleic acid-binding protein